MKQWCLFFVFLVFCTLTFAETTSAGVLVPRDVYVGDTAVVSFTAVIPNTMFEMGFERLLPKEDIPQTNTARIDEVRVRYREGDAEIRIQFIPWKSGSLELPPITVEDHQIIPPTVTIASLLDRDGITTPAPSRSPLLIPGTTYLLYGGIIAFFFVAGLLWFLSGKFRTWLISSPARRRVARRVKFLSRELNMLSRRHRMDSTQWFSRLSLSLRRYLGLYFAGKDDAYVAATGKELSLLAAVVVEHPAITEHPATKKWDHASRMIRDLFTQIDRARFGGLDTGVSQEGLLDSVRELSRTLEDIATYDIS
ncbi:MAG TPA: hypothetical protein GXZ47_03425 [Treponema sp.]|nr:hypothetical protein [Treponema sp.]